MSGKSVIITGASQGLGRATTLHLAQLGACVTINARSEKALLEVKRKVEELGGRAVALAGDITQPDVAERLVAAAALHCGGVDAVINNAGMLEPVARIADSDPIKWQKNLSVNVFAPFLLTQAALPHLRRAQQGRVINVSSGAALQPVLGWSAYCTSKAALNMFTAALALEEPALVSLALRPGRVDTSMQQTLRMLGVGVMSPEQYREYVNAYREGKLLPPEVPARVLATLALHAPRAWSGRFIRWNDEDVQRLMQETSIGK